MASEARQQLEEAHAFTLKTKKELHAQIDALERDMKTSTDGLDAPIQNRIMAAVNTALRDLRKSVEDAFASIVTAIKAALARAGDDGGPAGEPAGA